MDRFLDWGNTDTGAIVLSSLVGVGLAMVFRRQCVGSNCIVHDLPPTKDLRRYIYHVDGECYRYKLDEVPCERGGERGERGERGGERGERGERGGERGGPGENSNAR